MEGIENNPTIGIGFSDTALIAVSLAGFCFLGFTVFSIISLRLKSGDELEKEAVESNEDYETRLVRSDVGGLTRAERRARARAIMKQQRRVQPARPNNDQQQPQQEQQEDGEQAGEAAQNQIVAVEPEHDAAAGDGEQQEAAPLAHLSRKARQKVAKALEKEERKLMSEERKQAQKEVEAMARKEKREREKRQAIELENQRHAERLEKQGAEQKRIQAWNTFLSTETATLMVDEWIAELQTTRHVSLDKMADRFQVPNEQVLSRIRELIAQRRVAGVVTGNGIFVNVSEKELEQIAGRVRQEGVVSASDMTSFCNSLLMT